MRDAFGEVDPDEVDIIDFIESDPTAFGTTDQSTEPTLDTNTHRPRWLIPGAVVAVIAIVAGVFAWSPWNDDARTFPEGATPELTLTGELVFDDPPAELTAASLGDADEDSRILQVVDAEGYFFAESGASWDFVSGKAIGVWANFIARRVGSAHAPDLKALGSAGSVGTVQGAPAVFSSGDTSRVVFGPVDGWMFDVITAGMSREETMGFAEAIGVQDGVPVIADDDVLGAMQPIGDIGDFSVAISTPFAGLSPFGPQPGVMSVYYGDFTFDSDETSPGYSIATLPVAGPSTLMMLRFVLGGEPGSTVHGQPAIVADDIQTRFGLVDAKNSIVAWVEGGRLIVVTSHDDVATTLALAQTVRPATDDELATVAEIAQRPADPSIPLFPDGAPDVTNVVFGPDVTLYNGVESGTGVAFSFSAQITAGHLMTCTTAHTAEGSTGECSEESGTFELPVLWSGVRRGLTFVLAVVEGGLDAEASLHITLADGTVDEFPLVDHEGALPGPTVATLLPIGHGPVELWIGDKLIATL